MQYGFIGTTIDFSQLSQSAEAILWFMTMFQQTEPAELKVVEKVCAFLEAQHKKLMDAFQVEYNDDFKTDTVVQGHFDPKTGTLELENVSQADIHKTTINFKALFEIYYESREFFQGLNEEAEQEAKDEALKRQDDEARADFELGSIIN